MILIIFYYINDNTIQIVLKEGESNNLKLIINQTKYLKIKEKKI